MSRALKWRRAARGLRLYAIGLGAWLAAGVFAGFAMTSLGPDRSIGVAAIAASALVNAAMLVGLVRYCRQPPGASEIAALAAAALLTGAVVAHAYNLPREVLDPGGAWPANQLALLAAGLSVIPVLASIALSHGVGGGLAARLWVLQALLAGLWIAVAWVGPVEPLAGRYPLLAAAPTLGLFGLFGLPVFLFTFAAVREAAAKLEGRREDRDLPAATAVER